MIKKVDIYVFKQVMAPLLITIGVSAMLLLLERMLRLFDMVANLGGPVGIVFQMLGNLIPRYIGLALPLGFLLGVLLAFRKLSSSSELEALQSGGTGLWRLMRAPIAMATILTAVSIALLGYAQPRSFYSYNSLLFELSSGAFGTSIRPKEYADLGAGFTLRIEESYDDGSRLVGIFAQSERAGGRITTITAREGSFLATSDGSTILMRLYDGVIIDIEPDKPAPRLFTFDQHDWPIEMPAVEQFRARGGREREMTLDELWSESKTTPDQTEARVFEAAFYDRVLRSLTMLIIPFLAVGLGVTAKRQQRPLGLVVGLILLLVLHKMLEFGAATVGLGAGSVAVNLFVPFIVFASLAGYFYYSVAHRVGVAPLGWLENAWQGIFDLAQKISIGRTDSAKTQRQAAES
ncbi:MAG: LptF/LptG family permease [Alphaproteobacteria bacterium]